MVIENLLKKVYRHLQKYSGDNSNVNRNNNSGDNENLDLSNNDRLNINKSNPYSNEGRDNYINANDSQLRKIIDDKDLKIEELRNIIDVYFLNKIRY